LSKGSAAKRWSRPLRHASLDAIAWLLLKVLPVAPMRVARAFCVGAARVIRWTAPGPKRNARRNLAKAYPEKTEAEREALLREMYDSIGHFCAETLKMHQLSNERLASLVNFEGEENAKAAKGEDYAKGGVFSTVHQCNWEMHSRWSAKCLGWRVAVVARRQQGGLEDVVSRIRERNGLKVLHRGEGVRPLVRAIREGATVAALLDQSIRGSTVPIKFFGHPALAHDGFARLALMADAPFVTMTFWRRRAQPGEIHWAGWRYEARALPPIWPRDAEGKRRTPEAITVEASNALERLIRMAPGQWMWFHDRWHNSDRDKKIKRRAAKAEARAKALAEEEARAKAAASAAAAEANANPDGAA
jgi:KDO2-lipid IV(A) lauroyltransferase